MALQSSAVLSRQQQGWAGAIWHARHPSFVLHRSFLTILQVVEAMQRHYAPKHRMKYVSEVGVF